MRSWQPYTIRSSSTVRLCWTCQYHLHASGSSPLCAGNISKIVAFNSVYSSSWQACLCNSVKCRLFAAVVCCSLISAIDGAEIWSSSNSAS